MMGFCSLQPIPHHSPVSQTQIQATDSRPIASYLVSLIKQYPHLFLHRSKNFFFLRTCEIMSLFCLKHSVSSHSRRNAKSSPWPVQAPPLSLASSPEPQLTRSGVSVFLLFLSHTKFTLLQDSPACCSCCMAVPSTELAPFHH